MPGLLTEHQSKGCSVRQGGGCVDILVLLWHCTFTDRLRMEVVRQQACMQVNNKQSSTALQGDYLEHVSCTVDGHSLDLCPHLAAPKDRSWQSLLRTGGVFCEH